MAHGPLHPAGVPGRATAGLGRLFAAPELGAWLLGRLVAERERWFLWLPVGVGTGVAIYFALPVEPPLWLGLAYALPLLLALVLGRTAGSYWRASSTPVVIAFAAIALGLAIAPVRTWSIAAPVLGRRAAYEIEARVRLIEERVRGQRLLLDRAVLEGMEPRDTPALVRVSVCSVTAELQPGDRVRLRALLMPPSPPSEPHGFDFARQAYFMRLGAVGYAQGEAERLEAAANRGWPSRSPTPARWSPITSARSCPAPRAPLGSR